MIADWKYTRALCAAALLLGGAGREGVFAREDEPPAQAESVEKTGEKSASGPLPSAARLEELTGLLESDDYPTRMGAQAGLLALASDHPDLVAEALVGSYLVATDPDLRARLRLTLWNAKRFAVNSRPIGFVGIQMQDSFRQIGNQVNGGFQRTVQVMSVIAGTAAEKHGLRIGDQIVAVDGKEFDNGESPSELFKELISARTVGEPVELKIVRGPQELAVKVELGERPMELMGLGNDERDRLNVAFNAFLREAAEKRGLALPGGETPETSPEGGPKRAPEPGSVDRPGADPFEP